jgi:hypothetical protein
MRRKLFISLLVLCVIPTSCVGPNEIGPGTQNPSTENQTQSQALYPTQSIATKPFLMLPFKYGDCPIGSCVMQKPDMEGNEGLTYPGHEGYDYRLAVGKPIFAAAAGKAYCRKQLASDGKSLKSGGYGVYVDIDHGNGIWTKYAHLDSCSFSGGPVNVGAGCQIGVSGRSGAPWFGYSTPHLHFEVLKGGPEGKEIDPYNPKTYLWISKTQRAVCSGLPYYAVSAIESLRKALGASAKNQVHWYHDEDKRLAIQDVKLPGGCDAGIVFDVAGGANKARVVKCGMWKKWAGLGGPRSSLGNPIGDEYGGQQICPNGVCFNVVYQDFQHAYLTWESNDPHNAKLKYYKHASPGKLMGARWDSRVSYIFADAFSELGGRLGVGYAGHPHGSSAEVHDWTAGGISYKVQDFISPKYGWVVLFLNPEKKKAFMIRSGFWQQYRNKGLLGALGWPLGNEYLKGPDHPYQEFRGGWVQYKGAVISLFQACRWSDRRRACPTCGICPNDYKPGGGQAPSKVCIPGQMRCIGGSQETCSSDGFKWVSKKCPKGCSKNHCDICISGESWCDNATHMQVCNSDGKSFSTSPCKYGCEKGRCRAAPAGQSSGSCPPGQTLCKDAKTQKTCSVHGAGWEEKICAHGCSNTRCMICKPGKSWCYSQSTVETCASDGFSSKRKRCSYRCDKDMCISAPRICVKGEKRCNGKSVEICSDNESTWVQKTICSYQCQSGACIAAPPAGKVCVSHQRRCVFGNQIQQCQADGMRWIMQFICPQKCHTATAACDTPPTCKILYDPATRTFGVTGAHGVTHFSSEGTDMLNKAHYMQTHLSSGTQFTVPKAHSRIFARNVDPTKDWPTALRECAFPQYARWVEALKGGRVEITK